MNAHVPVSSMLCMGFCLLFAFALPIGLCVFLRRRKGADLPPFFVGAGVMLLFAFVLESAVNSAIFASPLGAVIRERNWLYALFGGLMAGLFEETGRFLACKTALKTFRVKDENALMYGAGHGGLEAIVLLGITSINNLTYSVLINAGRIDTLTQGLPAEALGQLETVIEQLSTASPALFLLGAAERLFALALQLALSVLVWFAAKKPGRVWLFPLAILLHLIVDAVSGALSLGGVSVYLIEIIIGVMAVLACLLAWHVWRKNASPAETQQEDLP